MCCVVETKILNVKNFPTCCYCSYTRFTGVAGKKKRHFRNIFVPDTSGSDRCAKWTVMFRFQFFLYLSIFLYVEQISNGIQIRRGLFMCISGNEYPCFVSLLLMSIRTAPFSFFTIIIIFQRLFDVEQHLWGNVQTSASQLFFTMPP